MSDGQFIIVVLVVLAGLGVIMDERQKAAQTTSPEHTWRQCAPAQGGQELVSTTQWPDRTDCFYAKTSASKRMPHRKETTV